MKKVLFSLALAIGFFNAANAQTASAPALKIGIFDIDEMVQAMPSYSKVVDTPLAVYQRDSLGAEYDYYTSEFQRLDSTFKADSANGKAQNILAKIQQDRQQVGLNLVYWQQISQQKTQAKRSQLAQPLLEQVITSYRKAVTATKVTLILPPGAIMPLSDSRVFTDLRLIVAKDLGIPVNQQAQQQEPAADSQAKPKTTRPK